MDVPDVRYARAGGVAIAYQVVGDGHKTLVVSPHISDLLTIWKVPLTAAFLERLARELRVVVFNARGTGMSDRPRNITLEARMDDITAVLDAVGVERANLFGVSTSANACALLAGTYPERVERLVLARPYPRAAYGPTSEEEWLRWLQDVRDHWGEREFQRDLVLSLEPSLDSEGLEWSIWQSRLSASPSAAAEWVRMAMETDIVDTLSSIRAPTLVLHDSPQEDQARLICERVRDGRAIETNSPYEARALDAVLDFVRGDTLPVVPDSVLATVLFTDLVGSTERAAALGDRAWSDLLERHHAAVRRELGLHRGAEVDTAGDGFFCRFDGPARAIACARRIVEGARELDLAVRAGVHIGECEVVGEKIAGIAVVTGARISGLAASGEVLVSGTVKDLVAGSGLAFEERGEHELKGVPGPWRPYAVRDD